MMDRDRELHEMADEGRALMSDYIKREDAYSACCYETSECYMARKEIKALPSADVAPVRYGRWVDGGLFRKPVCSECGEDCIGVHSCDYTLTNYCPFCGAKMDKGGSNGTDD